MGEYYDKFKALSREQTHRLFEIENENSFDGAEDIHCPYCDTPQSLEGEDVGYGQDEETEHTCTSPDCGKDFTVTCSVSYSWSTQVPEEEAMEMLENELEKEDL